MLKVANNGDSKAAFLVALQVLQSHGVTLAAVHGRWGEQVKNGRPYHLSGGPLPVGGKLPPAGSSEAAAPPRVWGPSTAQGKQERLVCAW